MSIKKIASIGLSVTTAVWLSGATMLVPVASAQSVSDLQSQISALLAQIQALQAQLGSASGGGPSSSYNFTRDLTLGSTGADVKALQQWLNANGYQVSASGAGSPGNETEYFGNATRAALAKYQAAKGISPAVGYFGPKTRASLVGVVTPSPVPVPGTGLALSLASDNSAAQAVPKGATGVTFLKFNVVGSGTLDSLTFKRVGIGATADFGSNGVYLYDGNTRLTSGRSLNSTTHEAQFVNLALSVSGVRTLTLVADVASGATTGNRNAFQFVSGSGSVAVSGSLTGNEMTIAGQLVGGLAVNDQATPTNPKIGQMGALIQNIQLTASSTEDVMVHRLSITEGGSIANANLTNFVLKYAGNNVATAAAVGAKDLIVLNFATPFLLEKGQQRTFQLYADVGGSARVDDTINLYIDSASDVFAVGRTYGYPVLPDINSFDAAGEGDVLTLQGGPVTITFNGPVAGDVALRGQDVTLFDFTMASQNNIEIRNLRINTTTSNVGANEGFNDFKIWDVASNAVITSAVDITAGVSTTVFTDVVTVNAGQSRRFKVTADVDSDNDAGDSIQVHLGVFTLGDVKNLDNNTNVALADIVPNATLTGNTQTVRAPTVTVGLSASPSSQTYVQGANDRPLVGFSFQATGGDLRLDSVKVTATSTTGTLTSGEVTNLALWDGATKVSAVKSLDSSALTATFDSLNLTIPSGSTKLLTLRGNVSVNATDADVYAFQIADKDNDVTAYDADGNTVTYAGVNANSGNSVAVTISTVGDVTVATAGTDNETKADILLANGSSQTLGKFVFSAAREDMTVKKLSIMVNATSSASATSTTTGDEVPSITLWDGTTQIGGTYFPSVSGNSSSIVMIEGLSWVIPKDTSKTLTVKGLVNTIGNGADTGADVFAHLLTTGFEAAGSSASDNSMGSAAASGNRKVVYKSKPTLSLVSPQPNTGNGSLSSGSAIKVLRFRVSADANGAVAWRQMQVRVTMVNATLAAASTSNVVLRDLNTGDSLTLATVYSGTGSASGTTAAVNSVVDPAYVGLVLSSPQEIPAGGSRDYDLEVNFSELVGTNDNDSQAIVAFFRQESTPVNATSYTGASGRGSTSTEDADTNMNPSFIWSDRSVLGAVSTSSADWANGLYVAPALFTDVANTLRD